MKKLLATILALMMLMATFTAVSGEEVKDSWITPEKATLSVAVFAPAHDRYTSDLAENWFTQFLEEETNVHLDWKQIVYGASDDDAVTKLNLMLASDDLPDIILRNPFTKLSLYQAGLDGKIAAMNDYINEENTPNIMAFAERYPEYLQMLTAPDGNIYGLGSYGQAYHRQVPNKFFVNKKWMDALDITEIPTTTEDFYDMLLQFRDADFNGNGIADEVPIMKLSDEVKVNLINPFQYYDGTNVMVKDDEIMFTSNTEGYREALRYIRNMYVDHIIPEDTFTVAQETLTAMANEVPLNFGVIGCFSFAMWDDYSETTTFVDMLPIAPLEGPEGLRQYPKSMGSAGLNRFSISTSCSDPELALKWCDWFYTEGHYSYSYYGPYQEEPDFINPGWYYDEIGLVTGVQRFAGDEGYQNNVCWGMQLNPGAEGFNDIDTQKRRNGGYGPSEVKYVEMVEAAAPYFNTESRVPEFFMSADGSAMIAEYQVIINKCVNSWFAQFITGVKDIDTDWDTYLAELEGYGLSEYLEVYNKEYEKGVLHQ